MTRTGRGEWPEFRSPRRWCSRRWSWSSAASTPIERARALDPLAPVMHTFAAMIFAWAGRHDAAFEAARHALTLDRDHFQAHAVCGHLHDVTGRPDAALESYRTAYRLSAGNVFMPSTTHRDERRRGWCWADLMRRVFAFDVLACPRCGGRLRLIALIETSAATARILRHLGLPTEVPAPRPSRAPPSDWAA